VHTRLPEGLALIFDMDGVLVNSNPIHCEAWIVFNRRYGLETTEAMRQSIYGKRNDDVVRDFYGNALPQEEVLARGAAKEVLYREMIGERIEQILVPGLRRFLDNHRNDAMALASNAEPANVDFILDRVCLRRYFRTVVDGHQVHHPKPHPEIYLLTADLLGLPPANCVVFEDSFWGVEAARAAGARVIGLRTTHEDLPGVALAIDNFEDRELELWLQAQKPLA
jgi:beta-phosphoglucomutase